MTRGAGKWANRQGKRHPAVAYGCYLPDDEPNPLDIERDSQAVEAAAERERRKEARLIIAGVKRATRGKAVVGAWEADD